MTTEGGLDVVATEKALTETRKKMNDAGIEVSLFIAPDEKQIEASARIGSQFVELHTGAVCGRIFAKRASSGDDRTTQRAVPTDNRIAAADCRRGAGARARPEGECRTRIELRKSAGYSIACRIWWN